MSAARDISRKVSQGMIGGRSLRFSLYAARLISLKSKINNIMLNKKSAVKQANKRYFMCEDQELIDYFLLLRFGNVKATSRSTPILNYASIAKVVNISDATVRKLIMKGVQA